MPQNSQVFLAMAPDSWDDVPPLPQDAHPLIRVEDEGNPEPVDEDEDEDEEEDEEEDEGNQSEPEPEPEPEPVDDADSAAAAEAAEQDSFESNRGWSGRLAWEQRNPPSRQN
jgi:hypothetical protein